MRYERYDYHGDGWIAEEGGIGMGFCGTALRNVTFTAEELLEISGSEKMREQFWDYLENVIVLRLEHHVPEAKDDT